MSRLLEVVSPDIICGDDGYFVYWPTENRGYYDAQDLRKIADHIDEKNEPWEKEMKEYFEREG